MTRAIATDTLPVLFAVATAVAVGASMQRFDVGVHQLPADLAHQLLQAGDALPVDDAVEQEQEQQASELEPEPEPTAKSKKGGTKA